MSEQLLANPQVRKILKQEFLKEIGISQNTLAKAIAVPANLIHASFLTPYSLLLTPHFLID